MKLHRLSYNPPRYRLADTGITVEGDMKHGKKRRTWEVWRGDELLGAAVSFHQAREIAIDCARRLDESNQGSRNVASGPAS